MFSDSFGVPGIVLCKCSDNVLIGLTFYATEKKKKKFKVYNYDQYHDILG